MFSFWNSLEAVSTASTVVEITTAVLGIFLFVVERRETNLERLSDEPRRLSDDQKRALMEMLEKGPKGLIRVNCLSGDAEAEKYAKQFEVLFNQAGFPVEQFSWFSGGLPVSEFSVECDCPGDTAPPEHAATITNALHATGFAVHSGVVRHNAAETWVSVNIGAKPNANEEV